MTFADELMNSVKATWDAMLCHPFIKGMIDGTLDKQKFKTYLIQDTLYLKYYSKVYAWGFLKTDDIDIMRRLYRDMEVVLSDESMMHIRYLKDLGSCEAEALRAPILPANRRYLDYMLTISEQGTLEEGLVGLMPCALSYYYLAKHAKEQAVRNLSYEGNYYKGWLDHYSGEGYFGCYQRTYDLCNLIARDLTQTQKARLFTIFRTGTQHEFHFWDMSYEDAPC